MEGYYFMINYRNVLMLSAFVLATCTAFDLYSKDIFTYIENQDNKMIKKWLKLKPDAGIKNAEGQTVLHAAVATGKCNIVRSMLVLGVEVNARDNAGNTALDIAADFGFSDVVLELVNQNAKVTTKDRERWVRKLVSDYSDFGLFRFGSHLISGFTILAVSSLIVTLLCYCVGIPTVFGMGVGNGFSLLPIAYVLHMLGNAAAMHLTGSSLLRSVIVGCLWSLAFIGTSGILVLLGFPVVATLGALCIGIGLPQGYIVACIRNRWRSYMLPVGDVA